ncbi:CG13151, partial [Drosophila busckii]
IDCVLDEQLLSNIKSSENELEEVQDMELKSTAQADDDLHAYSDPLQETADVVSNFPWLFKDEDILLSEEQLSEALLRPAKMRGKRGRPSSNSGSYTSRNGVSWSLERNAQTAANEELLLPTQQACGKGPARNASNAIECWILLFDDEMMRLLLGLVNEHQRQHRSKNRPVDLTELRAWLGLTYLCGVFRNAQYNGPLEELWTLELGNAVFRASMTLVRFEFITQCLSKLPENSCNVQQRLWQKLLINCRSYYGASGWLCVDELPPSQHEEHTHLTLCCDAKTMYMTNALDNSREIPQTKKLMHLICDYKTTGRNITLGKSFASLSICEQLLNCQLSSICTPQAADYPKYRSGTGMLHCGGKRLIQQSDFTLLSCGLSTVANSLQIQQHTKQVCAQFYDLCYRYSTDKALPQSLSSRTSAGQFLDLFYFMLNVASVNAWILLRLSSKGDANMEQRDFQRQLGLFLMQQLLQRRLQRRSTTLAIRLQICEILGLSSQRLLSEASSAARLSQNVGATSLSHVALPHNVALGGRRRCRPCTLTKRESKVRSRCQQCLEHRCVNHLIARCFECTGISQLELPINSM